MTRPLTSHALRFQQLVGLILKSNYFELQSIDSERAERGIDFIATLGNDIWAIAIKLYKTSSAQVSLIESAASQLASRGITANTHKGMLVVSCYLPPALRIALEEKFSIQFADRVDLLNWAAATPELLEELNSLIEFNATSVPEMIGNTVTWEDNGTRLSSAAPTVDTTGTELCKELNVLKRGKSGWSAYEELCNRILRYLFPDSLLGWYRQQRTDDGLNRFDYVCRIRPNTEFWQFLVEHLNSRYILFEFKNYSARLNQGQILTTEKYLLERGLRRAAIIFSRAGPSAGATKMTQGAMREHGKLMLVLDDRHLCDMLHARERGEDATDLLFEIADEFLMTLPR